MKTQTIEESITQYTGAWNEEGIENIKAALEECWTVDSTYADPSNAPVKGLDELVTLIGRAQEQSPGGRFTLTSPAEFHHKSGCFKWRLTKKDGSHRDGMDYFEYNAENQIVRIVGFFTILSL